MSQKIIHPKDEIIVRRGDLYHVELDGSRGGEKQGDRPVLVVQTNEEIGYGDTTIVAPLTSQRDPTNLGPTEVFIPSNGTTNLPKDSVAQISQLRAIDAMDRLKNTGYGWVSDDVIQQVDVALKRALALE